MGLGVARRALEVAPEVDRLPVDVQPPAGGREYLGAPRALLVGLHALLVVRADLQHGVLALALWGNSIEIFWLEFKLEKRLEIPY